MLLKVIEHIRASLIFQNPGIDEGALWNGRVRLKGHFLKIRILRFRRRDALRPAFRQALTI